MKKSVQKKLKDKLKKKQSPPSRITNDTVAEHRERIISGGKRYKYPLQYTRRKLVINAIIIGVVTIITLLLLGWWQLYIAQNSNAFFYRITRILPLPVAVVDGEAAKYSDYLLNYRSSEHYLNRFDEIRSDSDDGRLQLQYKRREALDIALTDALARKIAKDKSLKVDQEELDKVLSSLRSATNGVLSEETSSVSLQRVLGLTSEDLRILVTNSLLRSKAAFAIDDQATQVRQRVIEALPQHENDFEKTATAINSQAKDSVQYGVSGLVNKTISFGGVPVSQIAELAEGEVSKTPIQSLTSDGYYFVKVIQKNDTEVNFAFIRVPLTAFNQRLEALKNDGKVKEYINIKIDQPDQPKED